MQKTEKIKFKWKFDFSFDFISKCYFKILLAGDYACLVTESWGFNATTDRWSDFEKCDFVTMPVFPIDS